MSNEFILDDIAPPNETRTLMDVHAEEEWRAARVGNVTGSRIYDIVDRNKDGKYSAKRKHYAREKLKERLAGLPADTHEFLTPAMQWGIDTEESAVAEYALESSEKVQRLGKVYIPHPHISRAGCSPDALVGEFGGLEVKCPETNTHLDFLRYGDIPDAYLTQIIWCLACMPERKWWDYMSYDPRCPEHMHKKITRFHRNKHAPLISKIEEEVRVFLSEVEAEVYYWMNDWKPS